MIDNTAPIGVFDSGLGGLTVAHAIAKVLPNESLIYIGDTAHLPYGDKSKQTIIQYSIKIVDYLLNAGCKAIVIACNSASSAAADEINTLTGNRALIINVIDPVVKYIGQNYLNQKIGLIGTKQTINSNVFIQKLAAANIPCDLVMQATALLAPLVEEGFARRPAITRPILEEYLGSKALEGIKALVLGCTHYPVLKQAIAQYYGDAIALIDAATLTATALQQALRAANLLNTTTSKHQFFITDNNPGFTDQAKKIFAETIPFKTLSLWQ